MFVFLWEISDRKQLSITIREYFSKIAGCDLKILSDFLSIKCASSKFKKFQDKHRDHHVASERIFVRIVLIVPSLIVSSYNGFFNRTSTFE